jgi:DNA-binding XRE family transcriptional regulator
MNNLTENRERVAVDWADIGSLATKALVKETFSFLGRRPEVEEGAWNLFISQKSRGAPHGLIVMTDLSKCASQFQRTKTHRWVSAVRSVRPYIVAFIRNKQDERCAALVDDIVQASENRMMVCTIKKSARKSLQACIGRALAGIDPNSIIDVRFDEDNDSLWVEFGDGKKAVLDWSRLGLSDIEPALNPSSAATGEDLDSIQVLGEDGSLFDIDSTAIRSLIDKEVASKIDRIASESAENVGLCLQNKRKSLGVTQKELARRSGLEQSLISKMERGRHQPRFTTLSRYAKGLRLSVPDLLA